jgi:hypothetical protein
MSALWRNGKPSESLVKRMLIYSITTSTTSEYLYYVFALQDLLLDWSSFLLADCSTPPRIQVALLSGYANAKSPGFTKALSSLKTKGLIVYPNKQTVAFIEYNEVVRIVVRRRVSNELSLSITVADVGWTRDASLSLA